MNADARNLRRPNPARLRCCAAFVLADCACLEGAGMTGPTTAHRVATPANQTATFGPVRSYLEVAALMDTTKHEVIKLEQSALKKLRRKLKHYGDYADE